MNGKLNTRIRIRDVDGFYDELLRLHSGLDENQSNVVHAKLVLLLANHIGDQDILNEALSIARRGIAE